MACSLMHDLKQMHSTCPNAQTRPSTANLASRQGHQSQSEACVKRSRKGKEGELKLKQQERFKEPQALVQSGGPRRLFWETSPAVEDG